MNDNDNSNGNGNDIHNSNCENEHHLRKKQKFNNEGIIKNKNRKTSSTSTTIFTILDDDTLSIIFEFLEPNQFWYLARVCRQFYQVYKKIHRHYQDDHYNNKYDYDNNIDYWIIEDKRPRIFFNTSIKSAAESIPRCQMYLQQHQHYPYNQDDHEDVSKVLQYAAYSGNLQLLQWYLLNSTITTTTTTNNTNTNNINGKCKYFADPEIMAEAARGGHLHILKWLRENNVNVSDDNDGCQHWNAQTCARAALNGHLEILQWARSNGCPWDKKTCTYAAQNGHLHVLQWARRSTTTTTAITTATVTTAETMTMTTTHASDDDDNVNNNDNENDNDDENNHDNNENNNENNDICEWDERTCASAAEHGHLHVLKWARNNGCPWDRLVCIKAAYNGHLDILKFAYENGCEWDWKWVCDYSALKYCSCAATTTAATTADVADAKEKHLKIIQWAKSHGYDWDEQACSRTITTFSTTTPTTTATSITTSSSSSNNSRFETSSSTSSSSTRDLNSGGSGENDNDDEQAQKGGWNHSCL